MKLVVKKNKWKGRSLKNYKATHSELARQKGVYEQFMGASTLTRARRVLFG